MTARAMTAGELALVRTAGQTARFYLVVDQPVTIFAARVNEGYPLGTNGLAKIAYDTVTTGAFADIVPGMTLLVGSTAGGYDIGVCRIRLAADATYLYIGQTSDLNIANNHYLTVIDEYGLWARAANRNTDDEVVMDYEIEYTDQHTDLDPIPVIGPDCVLWLAGLTVDFEPDASDSYVADGVATITDYLWTAPGADSTSDLDTATPTITYDAAGRYAITCTVTSSTGTTTTARRNVYVITPTSGVVTDFQIDDLKTAYESGIEMTLSVYSGCDLSAIRPRAKVLLVAQEVYNGARQEIGPLAGYEAVVAMGWIGEETITMLPELGMASFTVYGPLWWLDKIAALPYLIQDSLYADEDTEVLHVGWEKFTDITVDKVLWHLLHWRSTATIVLDVPGLTGNYFGFPFASSDRSSLLEQLEDISARLFAFPSADRYGRLWIEIDQQMRLSRGTIPVVMDLTTQDWHDEVEIPPVQVDEYSFVEMQGEAYSANTILTYGAHSPGDLPSRYGEDDSFDEVICGDQDGLLDTCGLYAGWINNELPEVEYQLSHNNKFLDVAPAQRVTNTLAAGANVRGLSWTAKNLIPREIEWEIDQETGQVTQNVVFEAETFARRATVWNIPGETGGIETPPGVVPPPEPPPYLPPPVEPPWTIGADEDYVFCATKTEVFVTDDIAAGATAWIDKTGTFDGDIVDASQDINDETGNTVYVATKTKVYKTDDLLSDPPTWTEVFDVEDDFTGLDAEIRRVIAAQVPDYGANAVVYLLVLSRLAADGDDAGVYVMKSTDGGSAWASSLIYTKYGSVSDFKVDSYALSAPQIPGGTTYWNQGGVDRPDSDETYNPWGVLASMESFHVAGTGITWYTPDPDTNNGVWEYIAGPALEDSDYRLGVNVSLSAGQRALLYTYVEDNFGAIGVGDTVDNPVELAMLNEEARTVMGFASRVDSGPGTFTVYIVWRGADYDIKACMDVGKHDPGVVYVGTEEGIKHTRDGCLNWADYIPDIIAHDLWCPSGQEYHDYDLKIWTDEGELYATWRQTLNIVRRTETTPVEQWGRIVDDPATSRPTFVLSGVGSDTFDVVKVKIPWDINDETITASVAGGRSIVYTAGHTIEERWLFYLSSTGVFFSIDQGDNVVEITGDWSSYSNGVRIFPLVVAA